MELTPEHLKALDHDLISAMPGGVVHVNADGSIVAANAEAERILGLRFEELTRRYVSDFDTETLREDGSVCPVEEYPVSRALATGEVQSGITIGVRHPDGTVKWAFFRATPVKNPATGQVTDAIVTFLDISERRLIEEELRAHRELMRTSQKLTKVGAWEWDMKTDVVHWTDEMLAIHGLRREDFDGTLDASVRPVHPDDRERLSASVQQTLESGVGAPFEYRIVRVDGTVITVLGWGEVVRDESGKQQKMVGALQDISQFRELEAQLRQAQRMESVGLLAGGVAHDFNNLLQVILANVDVGLRGGADVNDVLSNVQLAAERAAELTRQLMTFSRQQPFRARSLDLRDVLNDVKRLMPRLLGERVELQCSAEPGLPNVLGDAGPLQQVLVNLCINARDAMREGGLIRITAFTAQAPRAMLERQPEQVECIAIEVTDTGSGISEEVARRIFEPFFTTKELGQGTGLGLSVVYGIVEQHGGVVEVESVLGHGTTFRLLLPTGSSTASVVPPPPARQPNPKTVRGERILVVEDEDLVRSVVVEVLREAGYRVTQATDGVEALQLVETGREAFDVVLTDVAMPKMGGIELARRLRGLRPDLPIVFTTGYTASAGDLKNEAVLSKPYQSKDLLQFLASALQRA